MVAACIRRTLTGVHQPPEAWDDKLGRAGNVLARRPLACSLMHRATTTTVQERFARIVQAVCEA
jgi:hypothetical protein